MAASRKWQPECGSKHRSLRANPGEGLTAELWAARDAQLHVPEQKPPSPCPAPKGDTQKTPCSAHRPWWSSWVGQHILGVELGGNGTVQLCFKHLQNSLREMRWITDIISVCFSYKVSTGCTFAFKKKQY